MKSLIASHSCAGAFACPSGADHAATPIMKTRMPNPCRNLTMLLWLASFLIQALAGHAKTLNQVQFEPLPKLVLHDGVFYLPLPGYYRLGVSDHVGGTNSWDELVPADAPYPVPIFWNERTMPARFLLFSDYVPLD